MMVTFVSQCEKNALKKTRRVLDAFANRIGDNTWQTIITQEGLDTVKRMLRQTATRSTAVSCHWIRSRARSQFLWVVGNKRKFNDEGVVAVNWTEKSLFNNEFENDWLYLPVIKALAGMAALLHDWGKASQLFQNKLDPNNKTKHKGDPIRHEWISVILLRALIQSSADKTSDEQWLLHIINNGIDENIFIGNELMQFDQPFSDLPDAAILLSWLIVSHHRLPLPKSTDLCNQQRESRHLCLQELLKKFTQSWGYENRFDDFDTLVNQCFQFPEEGILRSQVWLDQIKLKAKALLHNLPLLKQAMKDGSCQVILHHARLCLMLGDHFYSSQENDPTWQSHCKLYANTDRDTGQLKQKLDEHLINVAQIAVNTAQNLPYFESDPFTASNLTELKAKPNTPEKFKWQDKAVKKVLNWRENTNDKSNGYFIVNMASTGCGKTIANAKIMQALSADKQSLRYILALGLRTLTLQTGDEYKERLGLKPCDLAVLIGSKSIYALHQSGKVVAKDEQKTEQAAVGSESLESLLEESDELHWEGILPEDELSTVLKNEKDRKLLHAPVLACTIDHIMGATETKRGGRYILPCLRLMSSDLVIDEIDDFTGDDLIAIGRLVYLAAMLGRKVMISSATIPPDLALGLFNAYRQGWAMFAASREQCRQVNCIYIDEDKKDSLHAELINCDQNGTKEYEAFQQRFIDKRVKMLLKQIARRKADIFPCPHNEDTNKEQQYFEHIKQAILAKHNYHHNIDQQTDKNISFGVVRMANIKPCVQLTQYLLSCHLPEDIEIRCMAYHSQQILLLRHEQEKHLDQVLKRKENATQQPKAFQNPIIREHIDSCQAKNVIFILVATPVEEVGRDHDFDWAVIEPSSYRSIIQMAGRVRRHREGEIEQPNIALMQYNLKGFKTEQERVFNYPGFETDRETQLTTHDLTMLVDEPELLRSVDAIPRIHKREPLNANNNLADLEHFATERTLGTKQIHAPPAKSPNRKGRFNRKANKPQRQTYWSEHLHGHVSDYWWFTGLPQYFKRFRKSEPSIQLYLLKIDEKLKFYQRDNDKGMNSVELLLNIKHQPLDKALMQRLWLNRDYSALLSQYSSDDCSEYKASLKFGEISFTKRDENSEYQYNDQLGLVKR